MYCCANELYAQPLCTSETNCFVELGIAPSLVTYLSLLNPIPLIYLSGAFIIAQILSKKALHLSWLGWQGKSISHYVLKTWICNWVHDVKAACHLAPLANFEPQWFVHLALILGLYLCTLPTNQINLLVLALQSAIIPEYERQIESPETVRAQLNACLCIIWSHSFFREAYSVKLGVNTNRKFVLNTIICPPPYTHT